MQKLNMIVGGKYKLIRKIGSGSFGDVYLGKIIESGKEVAIKIDRPNAMPHLRHEYRLYKDLAGGPGIPEVHYYGKEKNFNALVMELLGPSLEDLFNLCSRHFTLKTILMLIDPMIDRLQYLHYNSYIHRDVKPDNFLMGTGRYRNRLFIIDFGFVKMFRRDGYHIHYDDEKKNIRGTPRYASINAQRGIEQSRRDDMESLGYVMIYFMRGMLPWQGLRAPNKSQKYEKMVEKKMSTPVEELCEGFPAEFSMYLNYCRRLRFYDRPDYMYLRDLFLVLLYHPPQRPYIYDWTILKRKAHETQPNSPAVLNQNERDKEKEKQEATDVL